MMEFTFTSSCVSPRQLETSCSVEHFRIWEGVDFCLGLYRRRSRGKGGVADYTDDLCELIRVCWNRQVL